MTPNQERALAFVKRFLEGKDVDTSRLELETDLLKERLLSSLMFVEFLMDLEQETGQEVLLDEIDPADLRTVKALTERFFETAAQPDEPVTH